MSLAPDPASPPEDPLVGRTIAGKYAIESLIGGGSMGAVYRGRQLALDLPVAVKVMRADFAKDPTFAARFEREARAASRLDHPNLVRVLDYGEDGDGLLYLVMELLDGRQLFDVIYDDWPLSKARIVELLSQMLAALARAHDLGVVHRDVKPENVMVSSGTTDDGAPIDRVKVCDFGIAMLAAPERAGAERDRKLTTGGLVIGTPEYMSPEQARGEPTDARSDLYSVGVILFQLLTGKLPFEAATPMGIALRHVTDAPPLPSMLAEDVDPTLEAICVRAMAKKREDRFQTARELRAALRAAVGATRLETLTPMPSPVAIAAPLSRPDPPHTQPFAPKIASKAALPNAPTLAEAEPPSTTPLASGRTASPAPVPLWRSRRGALVALVGLLALGGLALAANGGLHRAATSSTTAIDPTTSASTTATMAATGLAPTASTAASLPSVVTAPSATATTAATAVTAATTIATGSAPRPSPTATAHATPEKQASPAPSGATSASAIALVESPPQPIAEPSPPPPAPTATSAPTSAPSIAPAPPPPPKPAPLNVEAAHVTVGAVSVTNGVPVSSVRKAIDVGGLTRCYRAALLAAGARSGGDARLHLGTDDQGYVTSASLGGAAPAGVRACIEGVARGWRVGNVDTGAAAADINLSFVPE